MKQNDTPPPADPQEYNNAAPAGCMVRLIRALSGHAAYLRAQASKMESDAEILVGIIPSLTGETQWRGVHDANLQHRKYYVIRRSCPDLGPTKPCVALWDSALGWRTIYNHLPAIGALEVYCPNANISMTRPTATPGKLFP